MHIVLSILARLVNKYVNTSYKLYQLTHRQCSASVLANISHIADNIIIKADITNRTYFERDAFIRLNRWHLVRCLLSTLSGKITIVDNSYCKQKQTQYCDFMGIWTHASANQKFDYQERYMIIFFLIFFYFYRSSYINMSNNIQI